MTTATTRIWTFATVIVIILVIALGWFLGISPKLADAARFDAERRSVIAQNDLARATLAQLQADFERIDDLLLDLEDLRAAFPTEAAYDDAVEELLTQSVQAGLTVQDLSLGEPSPTVATVIDEDVETVEPEVDGDGLLPTGTLLRVPVSVTVNGSLPDILSFIDAMQRAARFAIVSTGDFSVTLQDGPRMTISMVMYVVSGEDLLDVDPEPAPEPEPEPSESPTPEATDPAGTEPSAEPTPSP